MQAIFVTAILLAASSTPHALVLKHNTVMNTQDLVAELEQDLLAKQGPVTPAVALPPPPPSPPASASQGSGSAHASFGSGSGRGSRISNSNSNSNSNSDSVAGLPPPPPPPGSDSYTAAADRAKEADIWSTSCSVGWNTASVHTGPMTEAQIDELKKKFDCYSQKRQMIQVNFTKREVEFQDATKAAGRAMVANGTATSSVKAKTLALKDKASELKAASVQLEALKATLASKVKDVERISAAQVQLTTDLGDAQGSMTTASAQAQSAQNTATTANISYHAAHTEMQRLNALWTTAGSEYDAAHVAFHKEARAAMTVEARADKDRAAQVAAVAAQAASDKRAARMVAQKAASAAKAAQAAVTSAQGSTAVRRSSFDTSAMTNLNTSIAAKLQAIKSSFKTQRATLSTKFPNTRTVCAPRVEIDGADDLQREAMAVYYLSSDQPRPDATAADGVVRLAYENAYGQKLRYSAAEKGWLVDNQHQSGDGKAILWSASDTVCPSLAIDWQVFKHNDAMGQAKWTSTATRRSEGQSHVVVLPLNRGPGKDFPECTNSVTVNAPGIANAGGTYTMIDQISGADHRGRPVYENANGMQLYYWGADESWLLDPKTANGARRTKGTGIASSAASVECPSQAKGWVVWNDATKAWTANNALNIA